jgi:hypothetical protein
MDKKGKLDGLTFLRVTGQPFSISLSLSFCASGFKIGFLGDRRQSLHVSLNRLEDSMQSTTAQEESKAV